MLTVRPSPFTGRRKTLSDPLPSADLIRPAKIEEISHKFGCLLARLPEPFSRLVIEWGKQIIPDSALSPEGREDKPHVTLKYGFRDGSEVVLPQLKSLLASVQPFTIRLTGVSLFTGGKDGDVLKFDVDSQELHYLNRLITQQFDCENKYPKYVPHVTIAYLSCPDPGLYARYAPDFMRQDILIETLEFSGSDGVRETIRLGAGGKALSSLSEASGGALVRPARQRRKLLVPVVKGLLGINYKAMKIGKDKLGRRYCTDNGKRVKCPGGAIPTENKPPKKEEKPASKKPQKVTLDDARGRIAKLKEGGLSPEKLSEVTDILTGLTVKDLQVLSKENDLKTGKLKANIINAIRDFVGIPPKEPSAENPPPQETPTEKTPEQPKEEEKPIQENPAEEIQIDYMQDDPNNPVAKSIREDKASAAVISKLSDAYKKVQEGEYGEAIQARKQLDQAYDKLTETIKQYGENSPESTKARSAWAKLLTKSPTYKEMEEFQAKIAKEIHKVLTESLRPQNPITLKASNSDRELYYDKNNKLKWRSFKPTENQTKEIDAGIEFVTSITEGSGLSEDVKFQNSIGGRAGYNRFQTKVPVKNFWMKLIGFTDTIEENLVSLGKESVDDQGKPLEDQTSTVVHELGHALEKIKPGVKERVAEFIKYRLGDEKFVDMAEVTKSDLMKGEMVRKDKFDRAFPTSSAYYIGKEYKDKETGEIYGTEILSMGIEKLYRDPGGFVTKDPEYAQFIISLLRM